MKVVSKESLIIAHHFDGTYQGAKTIEERLPREILPEMSVEQTLSGHSGVARPTGVNALIVRKGCLTNGCNGPSRRRMMSPRKIQVP